jgi:tryptophan-rich sensory protein
MMAKVFTLVAWMLVCFLVAAIGAAASLQAGEFYALLVRPAWAPPASVFGPVWTLLYALMAIAAWLIWNERKVRFARIALTLFGLQLIVNALWSWLFFGWSRGGLAFVDIVVLWILICATLVLFWRIRPWAGLVLTPYLAWVTFAAVLNYRLWQLNPAQLAVAFNPM